MKEKHLIGILKVLKKDILLRNTIWEFIMQMIESNKKDSQYIWLYEGYGTRKDIIKTVHWLNKAKENGSVAANGLLNEINEKPIVHLPLKVIVVNHAPRKQVN
ncbi:hypothetical protein Glove_255g9 [Diversispora epigaea]|uniref:Uncharacterized protein n=1 Tax=Diversispora epigaea TaxID=1348612 RepID=A0A397I7Z8_9GLOM|nr:hypothetical protein Glove_255g9 [Diversispora epigaea]